MGVLIKRNTSFLLSADVQQSKSVQGEANTTAE